MSRIVVERVLGVSADGRLRTEPVRQDAARNYELSPGEFVQLSRGRQTKLFRVVGEDLLPTCAECIRRQIEGER